MDDLAKLISLAAAGCLVCAASFLYGELSGLGHLDLVWYLTFSDFVNFTPAMLVAQGIGLSLWALQEPILLTKLGTTDPVVQRRNYRIAIVVIPIAVILFGVAVIADYIPSKWAITFGPLLLLSTLLTRTVRPIFTRRYGEEAGAAFDNLTTVLFIAALSGFLFGTFGNRNHHVICTERGSNTADTIFPMDRGLALIEKDSYEFVPWSEIEKVVELDRQAFEKMPASTTTMACPRRSP